MSEQMFTREQVKDIISCLSYEDIFDEDETYEIIRFVLDMYGRARQRKTPDCLIRAGLHNAVEMGITKHYELGRG